MTVAFAEISLQSKHDLICPVAKVKAAASAHSMADVIPFFSVFIFSLRIQRFDKTKENIFFTQIKKTQYPQHCPCVNVLTAFGE